MTTIDKLDISVYNLYAIRTRMVEQINAQLHLSEAGAISTHTKMIDTFARPSELDILLGVVPILTPWAYFFPPKQFRLRRRSPFTFAKVIPSLKSTDENSENYALLFSVPCSTVEQEQERKTLISCFKQLNKLNDWLGFIIGRIGQFLQG